MVEEWEMETHTMAADNEDSKDNNIPEAKNLSNIYHMLGLVLKACTALTILKQRYTKNIICKSMFISIP